MAHNVSSAGVPAVLLTFALSLLAAQTPAQKDIPTLAREASPAVVRLVIRDQSGAELGSGSGFVASTDGKIITNYHVIHVPGITQAEARFVDGASYQIEGVLGFDASMDLAVLKLRSLRKDFQSLHLGFDVYTQTGEHVVAIGSPLAGISPVNTEATVSDGIISGVRDWSERHMSVLQLTAPISPGSSGGVLLNNNGDAVGVTFAQLVGGQNLNFAIPIAYVRPLLSDSALKSLVSINTPSVPTTASEQRSKVENGGPSGSYTGIWESSKFAVSGAATLTIKIAQSTGLTDAEIFLTGGEVTSANLVGVAHRTGEDIWTIELNSKKPKLHIRGIFRGSNFVGDYTYTRFLMFDQGQWILKKE